MVILEYLNIVKKWWWLIVASVLVASASSYYAVSREPRIYQATTTVVVGQGWSDSGFEAFFWKRGVMLGLGSFAGGGFSSEAFGVSADGSVVVGRSNAVHGSEAFVWIAPER